MAKADDFNDDYVANLLAEDARKTSQKYSTQGLSAFLPKRRSADAPKPNTRFLNNIVREADSHNAALKRREEMEAKRRLRELREENTRPRKRLRTADTAGSRWDGDRRGPVREDRLEADTALQRKNMNTLEDRERDRLSTQCDGSRKHGHHERNGRRERHPKSTLRRDSCSDSEHRKDRRESRTTLRRGDYERRRDPTDRNAGRATEHSSSDRYGMVCDPSAPGADEPVCKRGRGAYKASSGIEKRFAKDYDPLQDVSLDLDRDEDEQDWDLALEAMRDRAKWRQKQASRMREAGFDDKDISRWERGAFHGDHRERGAEDVRWTRKGEIREWDEGKAVG